MNRSGKRLFADLWVEHQFEAASIALHASVPECVIEDMMTGASVKQEHAESVLRVLSEQYNRDYSLNTVDVVFRRTFESKSEIARLMQHIDDEYNASQNALSGPAQGVAKHDIINNKLRYMGIKMQELGMSTDDDNVMEVLVDWANQLAKNNTTSTQI